jgi:hypothetical protein
MLFLRPRSLCAVCDASFACTVVVGASAILTDCLGMDMLSIVMFGCDLRRRIEIGHPIRNEFGRLLCSC